MLQTLDLLYRPCEGIENTLHPLVKQTPWTKRSTRDRSGGMEVSGAPVKYWPSQCGRDALLSARHGRNEAGNVIKGERGGRTHSLKPAIPPHVQ